MNHYDSPLGRLLLECDGMGITGLWFLDAKKLAADRSDTNAVVRDNAFFSQAKQWLDIYFTGRDPGFMPQLHLTGTPFRIRVGEIMCGIPFGKTISYGEIAARIARERGIARMSAQAVGGAVGHNPIGIIVPCHRVVGANGDLTGYGGGIQRKVALLRNEGADMQEFCYPKKGRKSR
ncbi:MAG: methylated-DNA--[protein]-cysteine S-methyltransferase [Mailhella sp.]|nr:methylated-DNA--[protein]-cysteine S-methyltransferase [Mailhella sp.]